jgi:hypothetical protein
LRLDQVQHKLNGDHSVYSRTTGAQTLQSGSHGLGVRRGDHVTLSLREASLLAAGAVFGLPVLSETGACQRRQEPNEKS